MSDYIKKEDAIRQVCEGCNQEFSDEPCEPNDCIIRKKLKSVPTADVVEVVRCKDCKHIKEEHFNILPDGFSCELSGLMVEQEHYCSYGERK